MLKLLGRSGGRSRGHHQPARDSAPARVGCDVIWGRRPSRPETRPSRPRTLVYPATVGPAGHSQQRQPGGGAPAPRRLKLGHINIRSLAPKIDETRLILRDNDLDVLAVSETWLNEQVSSSLLIFSGYQVIRQDRTKAKRGQKTTRGGGLAVLIRDNISVTKLKISAPVETRMETLWLSASFAGGRSAVIGAAYRPPDGRTTEDLEALRHQLLEAISTGGRVYLLGDMNIDLLKPTRPDTVHYITLLADLSLTQLISEPTHPGHTPSLIDHIVTNDTSRGLIGSVIRAHASDHDLIAVEAPMEAPMIKRKPRVITTRSVRQTDFNHLCLDLLMSDWSPLYAAVSADQAYSAFLHVWNAATDKHCPLKQIRVRHPECPWLTLNEDLQDLQLRRDLARRERDSLGTESSRQAYTSLRREFRSGLAKARAEFFSTPASPAQMWKTLRSYALSSSKSKADGSLDEPTAAAFNQYFAGVGGRIAEELAAQPSRPLPPRPPAVTSAAHRIRPATLPELGAALRRMSNSTAVGSDGVSLQLIRRCFPVVGPHILHVLNMSFVIGQVPTIHGNMLWWCPFTSQGMGLSRVIFGPSAF